MKIEIGRWTITVKVEDTSVFSKIDNFLRDGKKVMAIKELRAHRLKIGGDASLKSTKAWCDNRQKELGL